MNSNVTAAKAAAAAAIAAGTALWGWFGWLVILWALCMVLDYVSGSAAALKAGRWSSTKAREGLWHKAGMILAAMVASLGDVLIGLLLAHMPGIALPFQYSVLLAPVVVAWYILTELGSVAENAVALGASVPSWLSKLLKSSAEAVDRAGNDIVGKGDKDA